MKIAAEGRTALVIGGQGTVGQAIVAALSASGATVIEASSAKEAVAAASRAFLFVHISDAVAANLSDPGDGRDEAATFEATARAVASSAERIVHVISAAGVVPLRNAASFSAHQAALASLTRTLAMELAPRVAVNALAVGGVDDAGERFVRHSPLKRSGTPAEIANAALFLADPANTYTTGHVMTVDGGWSVGYARDF
ncbi:MAG: SDR family oxidoreductase [Bauldia sp.]|nr:SDR family oxidoreductase [Bauldia sp.]